MTTTVSSGGASSQQSNSPEVAIQGLARLDDAVVALDHVGVHPHGHRRVRVAKPAGDRTDVMSAADGGGSRPVPEVVKPPLRVDTGRPAGRVDHQPMRAGGGPASSENRTPSALPLGAHAANSAMSGGPDLIRRRLAVFVAARRSSGRPRRGWGPARLPCRR